MAKKKKTNNRKFLLTAGGSVLMLVIAFFALGGPDYIRKAYQGRIARYALTDQQNIYGTQLAALGLKPDQKASSVCEKSGLYGYGDEILQCIAKQQNYVVIKDKKTAIEAAEQIEKAMKDNQWKLVTNSGQPSLKAWVKNVSSRVDYLPDTSMVLEKEDFLCDLHFFVAYSNPKPPAYQISLECESPNYPLVD